MKTKIQFTVVLTIALALLSLNSNASVWTYIVDLEGQWSFSVGDNPEWAKPSTDVSDWDKIFVPAEWERYYENYNGYGWYRKNFNIKSLPEEGTIALLLGCIDDVDEVFINGIKVGQTGSFFPNYKSAYDIERIYYIPKNILKTTDNVIAIRVYDEAIRGGIYTGRKIGLCYDNNQMLLSLDLSGKWKFSPYSKKDIFDIDFDDSKWHSVSVPSPWEYQGFEDLDGYGWYRKRFTMPSTLRSERLYLVLGKIDDTDRVYLNGRPLGRTESKNYNNRRNSDYKKHRIYEIPSGYLKAENIVVVEVRDYQGIGGIYEGPVGIMTKRNMEIYSSRIEEDMEINSFGDFIRWFID